MHPHNQAQSLKSIRLVSLIVAILLTLTAFYIVATARYGMMSVVDFGGLLAAATYILSLAYSLRHTLDRIADILSRDLKS